MPLSRRLREATAACHAQVERSPFVAQLAAGRVDRAGLARYFVALLPVYTALEEALDGAAPESPLAAFRWPELDRVDPLLADIAALTGISDRSAADWAAEAPLMAHMYAGRIRQLRDAAPLLITAHAYVRYLGDVSGGQMLKRAAAQGAGIAPGEAGLSFFEFEALAARFGGLGAFKTAFRSALDVLPLAPGDDEQLAAEAIRAFELNGALFDALGGA